VSDHPVPDALTALLDVLRCPQCGKELHVEAHMLRCPDRHSFDIARQGYAGLLGGASARSGDDPSMARARTDFLATGRYAPLRDAIAHAASEGTGTDACTVLDAGCGTGYYLAGLLDAVPWARGLGLDTSTRSLREAARAHPRAAAASWDVFRPFPLADGCVDVLLDVFSPRNPGEFQRVLRPDGRLVVARPTAQHLAELRASVPGMVSVDPAKEDRLHAAFASGFEEIRTDHVVQTMTDLTGPEVGALIGMTPSARHVDLMDEAVAAGDIPGSVTLSVLVTVFRRR
jgi:23S rRNA (guanine745-N1)-methyltransferase